MSSKRKKSKKKLVIKKRFFVICVLIIIIILFFIIMGIKSVAGMIFGSDSEESADNVNDGTAKVEQNVNADNKESSNADTNAVESDSSDKEADDYYIFEEVKSAGSMENEISAAVLSSWFISPLGQNRSTVEENFGILNRSEDWDGKIYYHKSFVDTMYVTYEGKIGYDDLPTSNAVCDSVSIALGNIKDFKRFTPDSSIWGKIQTSEGNLGEEYYYSVRIRDDIRLIVYCEKDGSITKDTHIIVSLI